MDPVPLSSIAQHRNTVYHYLKILWHWGDIVKYTRPSKKIPIEVLGKPYTWSLAKFQHLADCGINNASSYIESLPLPGRWKIILASLGDWKGGESRAPKTLLRQARGGLIGNRVNREHLTDASLSLGCIRLDIIEWLTGTQPWYPQGIRLGSNLYRWCGGCTDLNLQQPYMLVC